MERRPRRAESHKERYRIGFGVDGLQAPAQHHRCADIVLGRDPRRRGRFPCRGVVLHLYRTGSLFLYRRDQLPGFAFSFRNQNGRPHQRQTATPGYLGPADEKRHYGQPKQIRIGWFGLREIVLHEPYAAPVLGAGSPYPLGRYGELLSGTLLADP